MNCYHCVSKPATCIGAYENAEIPAPACDECCGHGNEDGWCIPTASLAEREELVQHVIMLFRTYRSALRPEQALRALVQALSKLAEWSPT